MLHPLWLAVGSQTFQSTALQGISSLVLQSNSRFWYLKKKTKNKKQTRLRPASASYQSQGKGAFPEVSWSYLVNVLESHSPCVSLQLNGRRCSCESNLANTTGGNSKTIAQSSRWLSSICLAQPRECQAWAFESHLWSQLVLECLWSFSLHVVIKNYEILRCLFMECSLQARCPWM